MRLLLRLLCGFTILASTWLTAMYFVLRHPGYELRAAMSVGFVLAGVLTLGFTQLARPSGWLRAFVGACAIALIWAGSAAVDAVLRPGAHFEGYALVIGAALVCQGALTLLMVTVSRPIGLRRTSAS